MNVVCKCNSFRICTKFQLQPLENVNFTWTAGYCFHFTMMYSSSSSSFAVISTINGVISILVYHVEKERLTLLLNKQLTRHFYLIKSKSNHRGDFKIKCKHIGTYIYIYFLFFKRAFDRDMLWTHFKAYWLNHVIFNNSKIAHEFVGKSNVERNETEEKKIIKNRL